MASSRAAVRRLGKDYKNLQENPVVGGNAAPTDDNIFVWHMNFLVSLTVGGKVNHIPLHAIFEAPEDYPQSAPSVGFCVKFPYNMGAHYINQKEGPLKNTLSLCLNILGNFSHVHTEWKAKEGEGWSPSMSVETCIVNLQALLTELDGNLSVSEKKEFIRDCKRFEKKIPGMNITHTFQNPWPPIATQQMVKQKQAEGKFLKRLDKIPAVEVKQRINAFLQKIPGKNTKMEFCEMMTELMEFYEMNSNNMNTEEQKSLENDEIRCYVTQSSYQEELLGYGVVQDKKQLKTPGELLSQSAFDEEGVRFSSTKKSFTHWLPAFINPTHTSHSNWYSEIKKRLQILADLITENKRQYTRNPNAPPADPILEILPNLINSMIVEIMKSEKASAISYFEALCSFWRTLRFFLFESPNAAQLYSKAMGKMKQFCTTVEGRHKDNVPDVGQFLALYTCLTDKIREPTFVDAYVSESSVRGVMWWKGTIETEPNAVFEKTKIGRGIFMFQMTVCRILLNGNPVDTCLQMDRSCGKLPERLDALQKKWKQVEPSIRTWEQYFRYSGCSSSFGEQRLANLNKWLRSVVLEADKKGPKYVKRQRNNYRRNNHGSRDYNRDYNRRGRGRGRQNYRRGGHRQNYI